MFSIIRGMSVGIRSLGWRVRAIRGAITVEANTVEAITVAVNQLLGAIGDVNAIQPEEIVNVIFSVTPDLDVIFPAAIARQHQGWDHVPLLDVQQMIVTGSLDRCIRVLIQLNTPLPQQAMRHIYLRGAAHLRPDLATPLSLS